jgi:hypothetical protein
MSEVTTNAAEPIVSGTAQAKIEFVSVGRIDLSYPRTPEKSKIGSETSGEHSTLFEAVLADETSQIC